MIFTLVFSRGNTRTFFDLVAATEPKNSFCLCASVPAPLNSEPFNWGGSVVNPFRMSIFHGRRLFTNESRADLTPSGYISYEVLHVGQANTDSTDLLVCIGNKGTKKRQKWLIHLTSSNICRAPHFEQCFSRIMPPSTLTLRGLVPTMRNMQDHLRLAWH